MRRVVLVRLISIYFPYLLTTCDSSLIIETRYHTGMLARFPVTLSRSPNDTTPAYATLDLARFRSSLFTSQTFTATGWFEPSRILLGGRPLENPTTIEIEYDIESPVCDWDEFFVTAVIAGTQNENFSDLVNDFLMVPTTNTTGVIITNVSQHHIATYVLAGEMFYTQSLHATFWVVPVTIRIATPAEEAAEVIIDPVEYSECVIHTIDKYTFVPRELLDDIIVEMGFLGIQFQMLRDYDGISRVQLIDVNETQIAQLPTLEYIVHAENGGFIHVAELTPLDYTEKVNEQTREMLIRSTFGPSCTLTPLVLRQVAVHYDRANARIGFGEPLADIIY